MAREAAPPPSGGSYGPAGVAVAAVAGGADTSSPGFCKLMAWQVSGKSSEAEVSRKRLFQRCLTLEKFYALVSWKELGFH